MSAGQTVYFITSILCWAFLLVIALMPRRSADADLNSVMWMLTAYMSIYVAKIVYCIFSLLGRIPGIFGFGRWKWMRGIGVAASIGVLIIVGRGVFYTRYDLETVRISLDSKKLPASFDGYRIAQISDLHLGTWGNDTTFISNLVDSVNGLKPDLIVFTGDLVNQKSSEVKPFINILSRLQAKDGVYSVFGNHDYGDYVNWKSKEDKDRNLNLLKKYEKQAGWKMLNNAHVYLHRGQDSIALIGVENWGEPPFAQYGDINKAYPATNGSHLKDGTFKILLTHNPEHWVRETRKETNIDLTLSGHTHAMQMSKNLFGRRYSPSALRYPTWGGFYTTDASGEITDLGNPTTDEGLVRSLEHPGLYVNIGAGEVGMPYRLGDSNPEITLIQLVNEE